MNAAPEDPLGSPSGGQGPSRTDVEVPSASAELRIELDPTPIEGSLVSSWPWRAARLSAGRYAASGQAHWMITQASSCMAVTGLWPGPPCGSSPGVTRRATGAVWCLVTQPSSSCRYPSRAQHLASRLVQAGSARPGMPGPAGSGCLEQRGWARYGAVLQLSNIH